MRPNVADESTISHSRSHLPKSPFMGTESVTASATAENSDVNDCNALSVVDSAPTSASTSVCATLPISLSASSFDQYRMHLYNYALQAQAERLRFVHSYGNTVTSGSLCPTFAAAAAAAAAATATAAAAAAGASSGASSGGLTYAPRWPFPISLFQSRLSADEPKPQYSYIGLIAMAILSSPESKLVLSDIYQYILDNYPYFRSRGPGWRNSIRHNLSLNDCFIKAGRSANGKGHYWAIHPANIDDFKKGDFRRRKAQRKVRKHMGLAVDDDGNDSPSPPPITPPPPPPPSNQQASHPSSSLWPAGPPFVFPASFAAVAAAAATTAAATVASSQCDIGIGIGISRKRQFDVASLLAPDDHAASKRHHHRHLSSSSSSSPPSSPPLSLPLALPPPPPPPPPPLPPYRHLLSPSVASQLQLLSSSSGDEDETMADVDVVAGVDLPAPTSPETTVAVAAAAPSSPSNTVSAAPSTHSLTSPSPWNLGVALSSAAGLSSPQHQQLVAKYYEHLNQARTIRLYQQLQMQRRLCVVDLDNSPPKIEEVENSG